VVNKFSSHVFKSTLILFVLINIKNIHCHEAIKKKVILICLGDQESNKTYDRQNRKNIREKNDTTMWLFFFLLDIKHDKDFMFLKFENKIHGENNVNILC
jgi:exopolysaccharide biosynthesis predicted pyruvyltransferase EpsI